MMALYMLQWMMALSDDMVDDGAIHAAVDDGAILDDMVDDGAIHAAVDDGAIG